MDQGVLVSRTRDMDDHVTWLLSKGRFEEALVTAEDGVDGRGSGIKAETYEKVRGGSKGRTFLRSS